MVCKLPCLTLFPGNTHKTLGFISSSHPSPPHSQALIKKPHPDTLLSSPSPLLFFSPVRSTSFFHLPQEPIPQYVNVEGKNQFSVGHCTGSLIGWWSWPYSVWGRIPDAVQVRAERERCCVRKNKQLCRQTEWWVTGRHLNSEMQRRTGRLSIDNTSLPKEKTHSFTLHAHGGWCAVKLAAVCSIATILWHSTQTPFPVSRVNAHTHTFWGVFSRFSSHQQSPNRTMESNATALGTPCSVPQSFPFLDLFLPALTHITTLLYSAHISVCIYCVSL